MGAARNPTAEPTPALDGTITRETPIFSATRAACSGAAPPKAISVCWPTTGAALDRMHARGARHVLAHDFVHGVSRRFRRQSQRLANVAQQGLSGQFGVELDGPACECVGIDLAERDIRIGHGGA